MRENLLLFGFSFSFEALLKLVIEHTVHSKCIISCFALCIHLCNHHYSRDLEYVSPSFPLTPQSGLSCFQLLQSSLCFLEFCVHGCTVCLLKLTVIIFFHYYYFFPALRINSRLVTCQANALLLSYTPSPIYFLRYSFMLLNTSTVHFFF